MMKRMGKYPVRVQGFWRGGIRIMAIVFILTGGRGEGYILFVNLINYINRPWNSGWFAECHPANATASPGIIPQTP